jgi:hypothetical protein
MRVVIDLAVIGALSLVSLVRLPGLGEDAPGSLWVGIRHASIGIGTLGLRPVIAAFLAVETIALIVPSLRGTRLGGPAGRAALGRAAIALSAAIAFLQGFGLAPFPEHPGWPARLLVCVTVSGFTMLLLLGISVMDRWGFGAAFSIWLLWRAIIDSLTASSAPSPTFLASMKLALVAIAAVAILRSLARPPKADSRSSLALPLLASGTVPIAVVTSLVGLPVPGFSSLADKTAVQVSFAALAAVVLSRFFQTPSRVARVVARAEALKRGRSDVERAALETQATRLARVATSMSVLFVVLVELLLLTPPRAHWVSGIGVWLIVAPAMVLDLFDEWRGRRRHPDLVSIWPEHRPYAAHAARTILEQANIFVLLRGIHYRTCLQFFGPYVPIDIMVPAAYADQAVSLVNGVLDERYEVS